MPTLYTLTPLDGGPPLDLTQAEFDRFFDNRNPGAWRASTVVTREVAIAPGGCAPPVLVRAQAGDCTGMFAGGPIPPEALADG